jgi:hypothetical protein
VYVIEADDTVIAETIIESKAPLDVEQRRGMRDVL